MRKTIVALLLIVCVASVFSRNITNAAPIKISKPNEFGWNYPIQVFKEGSKYSTNFDVAKLRPKNGKSYYVDVNKGSDKNPGTVVKPFKSIYVALRKADVGTVYVADGIYSRKTGFNEFKIQKDVSIIAQGKNAIITTQDVLTWTSAGNGVYKAKRSAVSRVLDSKFVDAKGDYFELQKVEKLQEVTPGTYFNDGSNIYVKTKDGRAVDSKIIATLSVRNLQVEGGATVYVEGIKLYGGLYAASVRKTGNGKAPTLYAKNIEMKYSHQDQNGLNVLGANITVMQNSLAAKNGNDGFNYHAFNGTVPKAVEINCIGRDNGQESETDNGSTMHDGGKIIRINGEYYGNRGPNIADVSDGTESWNIGVSAHNSISTSKLQNADFHNKDGKSKMWLEDCRGYGSLYSIYVLEGTTYTRAGKFDVEEGNILSY